MTVYIGARDLNGLPVGTHQFIVITFPTPQTIIIGRRAASSRTLGPNVHGIVIGAQNRGSLKVEAFEDADTLAAREYFGGVEKKWYESDYDAELHIVKFNGATFSPQGEKKLISSIGAYIINQLLDPIRYPTAGMGFNSNSWAQSAIKYAGGTTISNMAGLDIFHHRRIPETYFLPYCPSKPRVKLNH
mgnify:CR=1 FL=1